MLTLCRPHGNKITRKIKLKTLNRQLRRPPWELCRLPYICDSHLNVTLLEWRLVPNSLNDRDRDVHFGFSCAIYWIFGTWYVESSLQFDMTPIYVCELGDIPADEDGHTTIMPH